MTREMLDDDDEDSDHDPLMRLDDDPENDTVHHPYSAYNQGYSAGEQDVPESLNPYEEGSREYMFWADGYDAAQEE